MSHRKKERSCEACGQTFIPPRQHARACSPACQQHLRGKPAAGGPQESWESWKGRTLYSVPRTPPFLVVGRPILAETERLIFTSNSNTGQWEPGSLHAAAFEKSHLMGAGATGAFAEFGTVFLRLEDAEADSARRIAEERERIAEELRRERERERQRERQRKREHRRESHERRSRERQPDSKPDPYQCLKKLGLSWPCGPEDVKAAFRRLAHKHHPDKGGTPAAFIDLRNAYQEAVNLCLAMGQSG